MNAEQIIKVGFERVIQKKELQVELQRIYFDLFKERLVITCNNCIEDGLFRIGYFLKKQQTNNKMITSQSLFKLRPTVVLYVPAWHGHLTNDNLTDEKAIALLKLTSANIKHFEKYPENWRELISTQVATNPVVVDTPEQPVEETVPEEVVVNEPSKVILTIDDVMKKYTKAEMLIVLEQEHGQSKESISKLTRPELAKILAELLNA